MMEKREDTEDLLFATVVVLGVLLIVVCICAWYLYYSKSCIIIDTPSNTNNWVRYATNDASVSMNNIYVITKPVIWNSPKRIPANIPTANPPEGVTIYATADCHSTKSAAELQDVIEDEASYVNMLDIDCSIPCDNHKSLDIYQYA